MPQRLPPILFAIGLVGGSAAAQTLPARDAQGGAVHPQVPIFIRAPDGAPLTRPVLGRAAVNTLPHALARVDSPRKEIVIEFPPVDVPGAHGEHPGMLRIPVHRVDVPVSGSIHQFRVEIVDGTGRLLPPDRLHHVILFDPDHRELFVPILHRVLAASKETGAISVPKLLFGMPLTRGQRLIAAGMISNPDAAALRGARLRVVLRYVPPRRPWPLHRAYPWTMDVAFPLGGEGGSKAFDLPPGRSLRSWEGSPAMAGTIVAVGGHVHDYAVRLELRDVTKGEVIWEGRPVRDSVGRVLALPWRQLYRWYRLGIRVSPRHRYRVTVVYDSPTGARLPNAGMGEVAGLIVPDGEQTWPTVDPTDLVYRLDLDNVLRNMRGERAPHQHSVAQTSGKQETRPLLPRMKAIHPAPFTQRDPDT